MFLGFHSELLRSVFVLYYVMRLSHCYQLTISATHNKTVEWPLIVYVMWVSICICRGIPDGCVACFSFSTFS